MSRQQGRQDSLPSTTRNNSATTSSSTQLSGTSIQNMLSTSSTSPSFNSPLRNFDFSNITVRDLVNDPPSETAHLESYMEYLAMLNHRQVVESRGESSSGYPYAGVATTESLSMLTNTVNSSYDFMSTINDENGEHINSTDESAQSNETENSIDVSSGGSSAQVNDSDDVELSGSRDAYSASPSDLEDSNNRRESDPSDRLSRSPVIYGLNEVIDGRTVRVLRLRKFDFDNSRDTDSHSSGANSSNAKRCRTPKQSQPQPLELPTSTRLKITVLKWNVAAKWKWAAGDENCGICRMPFEACCIECKTPGDECPLALGACKHSFHMHCIVKWTETQNAARPQCPLCRQEWKFAH